MKGIPSARHLGDNEESLNKDMSLINQASRE
jgi:hypothetical protein